MHKILPNVILPMVCLTIELTPYAETYFWVEHVTRTRTVSDKGRIIFDYTNYRVEYSGPQKYPTACANTLFLFSFCLFFYLLLYLAIVSLDNE